MHGARGGAPEGKPNWVEYRRDWIAKQTPSLSS
jgi:hypothetical protein